MTNVSDEVINLCRKYIGLFKINNGQIVALYCPFCNGGLNGDKLTFAIGLHNGAFNCKRGKCGKQGSFSLLCNFFGLKSNVMNIRFVKPPEKTYRIIDENMFLPASEDIYKYFLNRKISRLTVLAFKIMSDKFGNIAFPFYENGKIVYVKIRKLIRGDGPKEWAAKDTKPILYNMDNVSFKSPLIITEGQIDAMSVYESGYYNVVSVPAGCNNLEWINLCWDWIDNFTQIILLGDNDLPGKLMVNNLVRRLGLDRCLITPLYPHKLGLNGEELTLLCKDANEILCTYGVDKLKEIIDRCLPAPVKGILNLADILFIDPMTLPRIMTPIAKLNRCIGGLGEGQITVFTGKRGLGKSTLNGQILLSAIDQGYKVCAYSGLLSLHKFLLWIFLQATLSDLINYRTDTRTNRPMQYITQDIQSKIRKWLDGKFYLFDNKSNEYDSQLLAILNVFTICARRFGCKLFLVDNLMSALVTADELNRAQAKFAAALKAFAVKYKVHVILVAHPRKTKGAILGDDVSGSSAITNLADNVISVQRPNLNIIKNRDFGLKDLIICNYNEINRRIFEADNWNETKYMWNSGKRLDIKVDDDLCVNNNYFKIQYGDPDLMFA